MKSFSEIYDDTDIICPYCNYSYRAESEDYNEDGYEEACDHCGKKFHYVTVISVSHKTYPDCELNDMQHQWCYFKSRIGGGNYVCSMCGRCKIG